MFGIRAYSDEILKFLPQLGISRSQVAFNPPSTKQLTCLVSVGGSEVRNNHCYVQLEGGIPFIQCLDPATLAKEPQNRPFIFCALSTAIEIDRNGYTPPAVDILIRPTPEQMMAFAKSFQELDLDTKLSVDIECDHDTHEITVFGFAYQNAGTVHAISIPLLSEQLDYWPEEQETFVWKFVAHLLGTSNPKVFQNFIFDTMMLSYYGVQTRGRIYDTMIAAHLIDPELPKDLASLGRLYLTSEIWKGRDNWASNESLWNYNAKDAAYTLLILNNQMEKMEYDKTLQFFETQLVPLSSVVLQVCERGWVLDADALAAYKTQLNGKTRTLFENLQSFAKDLIRPKITYIARKGPVKAGAKYFIQSPSSDNQAGKQYDPLEIPTGTKKLSELPYIVYEQKVEAREFNPLSHICIKDVLSALDIRIPVKDSRETVGELALLKIQEKHNLPFLDDLMEYRGVAKMLSTYCEATPDFDGRYRFSIKIPGTVEARFSSAQTPWGTGFNSQNIPKDKAFRRLIVPLGSRGGDRYIVNMDFKQADPHMVAWLSGEKKMLEILRTGDLHQYTADNIGGSRQLGKNCNNGLNYGMQVGKFIETCAKQGLTLSFQEAQRAYNAYFKLYPGIRSWQNSVRQQIIQTRTLTTPFGRKRNFYGFLNEKMFNNALSYVPPTTVADALNAGWLIFDRARRERGIDADVLGQCHDSLMLQVVKADLDRVCELLIQSYAQVVFTVNGQQCNLPVSIEYGPSWGELSEWHPS